MEKSIAERINLRVKFNAKFRRSGVYKYFDPFLIRDLEKFPLLYNDHIEGVPVKLYED